MAGRKRREDVRLVEPVSLLGLSLGEVLLGLMETGEGRPDPAPDAPFRPRRRRARCCGCACRTGGSSASRCSAASGAGTRRVGSTCPRVVTRREGKALACKLYRIGEGRALYAGVLKAAGARAFVEAAPGAEYRYRNAPLRRMTAGELAAAVDPGRVYDYDLLGVDG